MGKLNTMEDRMDDSIKKLTKITERRKRENERQEMSEEMNEESFRKLMQDTNIQIEEAQ